MIITQYDAGQSPRTIIQYDAGQNPTLKYNMMQVKSYAKLYA